MSRNPHSHLLLSNFLGSTGVHTSLLCCSLLKILCRPPETQCPSHACLSVLFLPVVSIVRRQTAVPSSVFSSSSLKLAHFSNRRTEKKIEPYIRNFVRVWALTAKPGKNSKTLIFAQCDIVFLTPPNVALLQGSMRSYLLHLFANVFTSVVTNVPSR